MGRKPSEKMTAEPRNAESRAEQSAAVAGWCGVFY